MGVPEVVKLQPASGQQNAAGDAVSCGRRRHQGDDVIAAAIDVGDKRSAVLACSKHHGAAIGRLCMSMLGSQQDSEDVTQEVLLDAYASIETWRREGSARSWLLTIARRKCARMIEKRVRRTNKLRLVHDADQKAVPSSQGAEQQMLKKQRAVAARAALDVLRPSEREALLLRFGAGLSFREVGMACGIEEAAARKRVSRAIARLRETLEEKGSDR